MNAIFVGILLRDFARDFGIEFESSRHSEIFEISSRAVKKTIGSHLNRDLNKPALGPVSRSSRILSGPLGSFVFHSRFENCTVKLSAKETKWTSLEVKTHPTFLENLISKCDFGPVKLPGLSRNGPLVCSRGG